MVAVMSTQDSMEISSSDVPRPPQFETVEELLDMPNERLQRQPLVNVIGLVQDYQPPIPTKGKDFKCTLAIVDHTVNGTGMKVIFFWPEDKMPHISGVCDVVLLRKFKVQMRSGFVSLLANWASDIQVFPASKIPRWPIASPDLLRTNSAKFKPPSLAETGYIVWLFHHIEKSLFPSAQTFQESSLTAMNVKDKYSLLKDIKADRFYDLIGEVIRVYERDGKVTMYLSDYTAHSLFYDNVWGGADNVESRSRDGDEFGYTKARKKDLNDWPGPYGRLSLQLTVFDSHASYIREQVKAKDWVMLKNVHVKMGREGGCIEGFLRGDRDACEGKVQVQIIRGAEDAEMNDVRWKEGLRRKKEWWDRHKKQKREYPGETEEPSGKRRLDETESTKFNSKRRRKEKRAAVEKKVVAIEQKVLEKLDLNSNVKCNHANKPKTPISKILNNNANIIRSDTGLEYTIPFENVKYLSDVRVVDFLPHKLEDFAVGRRVSEFDVLSDYSGGESTDNEEDMRLFREGKGFGGEKKWEWRFALLVEDANKNATGRAESIWLIVDNQAAQMLLNMDAVNLRQDGEALIELREVLFRLWGDLEEKKSAYLATLAGKALLRSGQSAEVELDADKQRISLIKPGDELPPDSSDDEKQPNRSTANRTVQKAIALSERNPNVGSMVPHVKMGDKKQQLRAMISSLPVSNKGFTCCIQQYGIKVPESSSSRADAGKGLRWKRVFGLFGTKIV